MWSTIAEAYGWKIPPAELERVAQRLDTLRESARRTFDRDLSTVEPVMVFRPGSEAPDAG